MKNSVKIIFFLVLSLGLFSAAPAGENSKVKILDSKNFNLTIQKGVVIVDFWATWCRPCIMQAPIIEELAKEMPSVKFGKVDVDKNRSIATKYSINSIPTMIIFKNGIKVKTIVGLNTKQSIKSTLELYLDK